MSTSKQCIETVLVNGFYQVDSRFKEDRRKAFKHKHCRRYERRIGGQRRQQLKIDVEA